MAAVTSFIRRSPLTAGYLALLATTFVVVQGFLPTHRRDSFLLLISTNVANLPHRPLQTLFGSALLFVPTTNPLSLFLLIGVGLIACMGSIERRFGSLRAGAVFLAGHIGATLLTAPVIVWAVHAGRYPQDVRHDLDYGVSYGAIACIACAAILLARPMWRIVAALLVLGYPLTSADWYGLLPDYTSVGHLFAATIGFCCGALLVQRGHRVSVRSPDSVSAAVTSDDRPYHQGNEGDGRGGTEKTVGHARAWGGGEEPR